MAKSHNGNGEKPIKYEYLDHTADVQLHAWGDDLKEAFEQVATAMFGYMTELTAVEIEKTMEITAQGDDMINLLFHFLDEFLFLMCDDPYFIVKEVEILEFDKENFSIRAVGRGELFDLNKHPQVIFFSFVEITAFNVQHLHDLYNIHLTNRSQVHFYS
ncbi:protein archease-like isoform X1 [Pocillopora damicornis]|uniref:protein archease-like isoform X1 n=1 Tax=Pocillopora damicornis TaxID=46731 RepID=UPI000F554891|nr:protein archease-like isoform X1 [Pocillopora damicornis]